MGTFQPHILLVTGGAGFIGANFIYHVLNNTQDIQIINLDKLTYAGSLNNLQTLSATHDRYRFIHGDIIDAPLINKILRDYRVDTIVHFAAESHVDRSILSPSDFVKTNILGTQVLLEAATQYWLNTKNNFSCRFHHISTDEVYGSLSLSDSMCFTEKTAYQPRSPYSASKASADHLVRAYYHTYQLPITISNCSNNYGPYQHKEKFIPTIIEACLKQTSIPIYGNGKNIRDWLYVEDHCRAIMQILYKGQMGESYNIGGNNEWENIHLATYICQQLDQILPQRIPYENLIQFVTDRKGHDLRYAINNTKITTELGWQPQESLETGINKTIAFYINQLTERRL